MWPLNNKVIDEKTSPSKAFTYFRTIGDDLMLTLTNMMNTIMMKNKMGSCIAMGCWMMWQHLKMKRLKVRIHLHHHNSVSQTY
jgi:hypothetical protein